MYSIVQRGVCLAMKRVCVLIIGRCVMCRISCVKLVHYQIDLSFCHMPNYAHEEMKQKDVMRGDS